jgi:hypothetical protein
MSCRRRGFNVDDDSVLQEALLPRHLVLLGDTPGHHAQKDRKKEQGPKQQPEAAAVDVGDGFRLPAGHELMQLMRHGALHAERQIESGRDSAVKIRQCRRPALFAFHR